MADITLSGIDQTTGQLRPITTSDSITDTEGRLDFFYDDFTLGIRSFYWTQVTNLTGSVGTPGGATIVGLLTGTTTNGSGQIHSSAAWIRFGLNPDIEFRALIDGSITNTDVRIGWEENPTSTGENFTFLYNSSVSSFWRVRTDDGSSSTVTTTSVSVAADTNYIFRARKSGSSVLFYIDGALVATHTTNLPDDATVGSLSAEVTLLGGGANREVHVDYARVRSMDRET